MNHSFVKAASTTSMLDAFEKRISQLQNVDSATTEEMLEAFEDRAQELGGQEVVSSSYVDDQGIFGEPGETYSEEDMRQYYRDNKDIDPSLSEYEDEDSWLADTVKFMSSSVTDIDDREGVYGGLFDFGAEEANKYGDIICEELSGQTISKRREDAQAPGGLVYEADRLGIDDPYDLLMALEGMCRDGRAKEIDDSTYSIVGCNANASCNIEGAEEFETDIPAGQDIFMLMQYSYDAEAGIDGDSFFCLGKFYSTSLEDAVDEFSNVKEDYPDTFEDSYGNSFYVQEYNEYFDDGSEVYASLNMLVTDILSGDVETVDDGEPMP